MALELPPTQATTGSCPALFRGSASRPFLHQAAALKLMASLRVAEPLSTATTAGAEEPHPPRRGLGGRYDARRDDASGCPVARRRWRRPHRCRAGTGPAITRVRSWREQHLPG